MSAPTEMFPVPSRLSSQLIPTPSPGVTPESVAALRRVLKDNHEKWHIFFNERGFHNHSAHRAIALWALGADGAVIEGGYKEDVKIQAPAIAPPASITDANFNDRLGDRSYYKSYLDFFTDVVRRIGVAAAVEQFIFSNKANFSEHPEKDHPQMFDRFLGALIHPMIHVGYGLEFGLPGMVAEGLAEAAVHPRSAAALVPGSFFPTNATGVLDTTISRLKSVVLSEEPSTAKPSSGVHAFTILARILADPELGKMVDTDGIGIYTETMRKYGDVLVKHVNDWHIDPTNPQEISRKIEELFWTNALIFGVGGLQNGKDFNADFFHMHLVTSSLFLPSYIPYLSPSSQKLLLRSYLLVSLAWWVSRGRPAIDIKVFYESTSAHLAPLGQLSTPNKAAILPPSSPAAVTPNPWFSIIENALVHPDDHLVKLQRSLSHFSSLLGSRESGLPDFKNTELPFAEKLDGSLFVRVAGLTARRLGRVKDGEEARPWDRTGFYQV